MSPPRRSPAFTTPVSLSFRSVFTLAARVCPSLHRRTPWTPSPSCATTSVVAMTHAVPATSPDGDVVISPPSAHATATATTETDPNGTRSSSAFDATLSSSATNNTISTSHTTTAAHENGNPLSSLHSDKSVAIDGMHFSMDEISELMDAVEDADLADFRYEHDGFKIEITRDNGLGFDKDGNLNTLPVPQQYVQPAESAKYDNQFAYATGSAIDDDDEDDDAYADQEESAAGTSASKEDAANKSDSGDGTVQSPDEILDSDFVVTSNRVGYFFAGAKNKPPLVNLGDSVAYNQPVCIIEQLGQQYVYLSEASGKVIKLFVEDGDAVEYGTQIMVIRPD